MSDEKTTETSAETAGTTETEKTVYPVITETQEEDGSTKVHKLFEDGSDNYTKTWPDGTVEDNKDITPNGLRFVVTRKKNGEISYIAPSGMKVEIAVSDGEDVLMARKNVGTGKGAFADESFMVALMATMCKVNGSKVPYEIFPKKFSGLEFLQLQRYFAEKNF